MAMLRQVIMPERKRQRSFLSNFSMYRPGVVASGVLAILVVVALTGPFMPLLNPASFGPDILALPNAQHLLGTDHFGRDLFSRIIAGTQTALLVAVASAALSFVLGVVLGSVSGYAGGWTDDLLGRVFDVFVLIPAFFLLILIVALFGASLWLVILVIGLTTWPSSAKIMRSQVLTYRNRLFVEAARSSGGRPLYLLRRHVVPNGIGPVITNTTVLLGEAILIEAGLSFLGLSDPKTISWGRMIFEAQPYLVDSPWVALVPGFAIIGTVMCLNVAGDGLTFAFSPMSPQRFMR